VRTPSIPAAHSVTATCRGDAVCPPIQIIQRCPLNDSADSLPLCASDSMRIFGKYARTGRQVNRITIAITNMADTRKTQRLCASAHRQIIDITSPSHNIHPQFTLTPLHQVHAAQPRLTGFP
jgi:hypothetical protein